MQSFGEALRIQRWDDHRYYHHSRMNQALHLLSALSFLTAYVMVFSDPVGAALIGWLVAMTSRQAGHFFFEPRGYDEINQATFEYKEEIKVGYNLQRKMVLLGIWVAAPALLAFSPGAFGIFEPHGNIEEWVRQTAWLWLWIGLGGLVFRTLQLCVIKDVQTGVVWCTKILTDPFHDVWLYWRAPLHLLRGEWLEKPHTRTAG